MPSNRVGAQSHRSFLAPWTVSTGHRPSQDEWLGVQCRTACDPAGQLRPRLASALDRPGAAGSKQLNGRVFRRGNLKQLLGSTVPVQLSQGHGIEPHSYPSRMQRKIKLRRSLSQRRFGPHPLRQVDHRADHANRTPVLAHQASAIEHGDEGAVRTAKAILAGPCLGVPP